jgi:hypothetical protein
VYLHSSKGVMMIKEKSMTSKQKKYHDWVYMADDQMNKVLKTVVVLLFAYGFYVAITEIWEKFT